MKLLAFTIALAVSLAAAALAMAQATATAPGKPTATLQRIDENRYGRLDPKYMSTGHSEGTVLLMKVTGLPFKPARAGDFKFTEITDDVGTDLMKPTLEMPAYLKGLQKINNAAPDNSFTISMNIGRSPRKATTITAIKGELTVLGGGENKETTVAGFAGMIGKTIDNEDFKKIGLTLTVREPEQSFLKGQAIMFDVDGPMEAVAEMSLLGADGKAQPCSYSATAATAGKPAQLFIGGGKIDATNSVKIKYVVGQQKVVIPMDYRDIPLP
jgi:hypothetical protein